GPHLRLDTRREAKALHRLFGFIGGGHDLRVVRLRLGIGAARQGGEAGEKGGAEQSATHIGPRQKKAGDQDCDSECDRSRPRRGLSVAPRAPRYSLASGLVRLLDCGRGFFLQHIVKKITMSLRGVRRVWISASPRITRVSSFWLWPSPWRSARS